MALGNRSRTISQGEQQRYLYDLDSHLEVLSKSLQGLEPSAAFEVVKPFGMQQGWNWSRFSPHFNVYGQIAHLVNQVRDEYSFLNWITRNEDSNTNRGYFEEVKINVASGLPVIGDILKLTRQKRDADSLLGKIHSYDLAAQQVRAVLLGEGSEKDANGRVRELQKDALRRNHLEKLQGVNLLAWDGSQESYKGSVIYQLGVERLINLSFCKFQVESGMYEIYFMDAWQDKGDTTIQFDSSGNVKSTEQFRRSFEFARHNKPWYMVKAIDEGFEGLHPVHLSRVLIGPFETKYHEGSDKVRPLKISQQLQQEDENTSILRCRREYTYAPNHETTRKGIRQVLHTDEWYDDILVVPGHYSARVGEAVQGPHIRIFEK